MSDPSDYHSIDKGALDGQTLNQLKDLQRCLEDRIDRKREAQRAESTLGEEVAKELMAEGIGTVTVKLQTRLKLMHNYRTFVLERQKAEDHPEVQAFIESVQKAIIGRLTPERLQKHGLSEESRKEVERRILDRLR